MGGGAGLGGEDGCSHGGTVSLFGLRSCPHPGLASVLVFVLLIFSFFGAACSTPSAPALPDATTRLQGIAAADPAKYPALQETKHWSNPYLVVRTDRVGLLTGVAANEEQILKPEEVLNALAQLPASAWPYGRAVAILVDEKPGASEQDKVALRRNRGIVAGELQDAHVAINWIPTS
jgi:hypothetical protein